MWLLIMKEGIFFQLFLNALVVMWYNEETVDVRHLKVDYKNKLFQNYTQKINLMQT